MNFKLLKILRIISKVILILVGICIIGYGGLVVYKSVVYKPTKVRISNVTDSSFTVSWVTDEPMRGIVYYKESSSPLTGPIGWLGSKVSYDDRDYSNAQSKCVEDFNSSVQPDDNFTIDGSSFDCENVKVSSIGKYYTHHVTVMNLDSEKEYTFVVGNGIWSWKGDVVKQKTFSILEDIQEPQPVFGKVVTENGNTSLDSIVYIQFKDGSEDSTSEYYSSTTNNLGGWYIDSGNVRDIDGNIINLELSQDTFDVVAQYKNSTISDTYSWVYGYFDEAYPDIVVKDIEREENWFNRYILRNVYAGTSGECTWGKRTDPNYCNDDELIENIGDFGAGTVAAILAGRNDGTLTVGILEDMHLCDSATACAGNISAITGNGVTTSSVTGSDGKINTSLNAKITNGVWSVPTITSSTGGNEEAILPSSFIVNMGDHCFSVDCATLPIGNYNISLSEFFDIIGYELDSSETISNGSVICFGNNDVENCELKIQEVPITITQYYHAIASTLSANIIPPSINADNNSFSLFLSSNIEILPNFFINGILYFPDGGGCEYELSANSNQTYTVNISRGSNCKFTQGQIFASLTDFVSALNTAGITKDFTDTMFVLEEDSGEFNVITNVATFVQSNSAVLDGTVSGNYSLVPDRGFIYSTTDQSLNSGTSVSMTKSYNPGDVISYSLHNLTPSTTYYFKAWASTKSGTKKYGDVKSFTTTALAPTLSPVANAISFANVSISSGVSSNSATIVGTIVDITDLSQWGVVYSSAIQNPTLGCTQCISHTGNSLNPSSNYYVGVSYPISSLASNTKYYVALWAKNTSNQDFYSDVETFCNGTCTYGFLPSFNNNPLVLGTTDTSTNSYFFLPEYGFYTLSMNGIQLNEKVEKEDNTIYVFYIEKNGINGLQIPSDPENPKPGEDIIIKSNAFEIEYTKVAEQKNFKLSKGINMISFNYVLKISDNTSTTAMDYILFLRGKGYDVKGITYFGNGRWSGGVYCTGTSKSSCSGNDFPLIPGKGYVVISNEKIDASLPAYTLKDQVPIPLSSGWNLVGINGYSKAYTAKSLIDSINSIEGLTADNVSWWPTAKGRYEGIQVTDGQTYGLDFSISPLNGYFVRIKGFNPSDKDCKSIIWHESGQLNGVCGNSK